MSASVEHGVRDTGRRPLPGWPTVPAGWPEPSRPAPARSRWMRERRWPKLVIASAVIAALTVLIVSALVRSEAAATNPANFNHYAFTNDTGLTVYVHHCGDWGCYKLDQHSGWVTLAPGAQARETVRRGKLDAGRYAVSLVPDSATVQLCVAASVAERVRSTIPVPLSVSENCGGLPSATEASLILHSRYGIPH